MSLCSILRSEPISAPRGAYEDVHVTPFELLVAKVSAEGRRAEWRFNPAFVRLEREEHEEFGTLKLALVLARPERRGGGFSRAGRESGFRQRSQLRARRGAARSAIFLRQLFCDQRFEGVIGFFRQSTVERAIRLRPQQQLTDIKRV